MSTGEALVAIILGLPAIVASLTAAYLAIRVGGRVENVVAKIDGVKAEVTPNNGLTNGETVDRVYSAVIDIKDAARTPAEQEHVTVMEQNEAEGGVPAE